MYMLVIANLIIINNGLHHRLEGYILYKNITWKINVWQIPKKINLLLMILASQPWGGGGMTQWGCVDNSFDIIHCYIHTFWLSSQTSSCLTIQSISSQTAHMDGPRPGFIVRQQSHQRKRYSGLELPKFNVIICSNCLRVVRMLATLHLLWNPGPREPQSHLS